MATEAERDVDPSAELSHARWCRQHKLVPAACAAVSETVDIILGAVHRFRPMFVYQNTGCASYFRCLPRFARRVLLYLMRAARALARWGIHSTGSVAVHGLRGVRIALLW